jgi:hypothetical protein
MVIVTRHGVSCFVAGVLPTAECCVAEVPEQEKYSVAMGGGFGCGMNGQARDNSLTVQTTP